MADNGIADSRGAPSRVPASVWIACTGKHWPEGAILRFSTTKRIPCRPPPVVITLAVEKDPAADWQAAAPNPEGSQQGLMNLTGRPKPTLALCASASSAPMMSAGRIFGCGACFRRHSQPQPPWSNFGGKAAAHPPPPPPPPPPPETLSRWCRLPPK